ncbi:helix-turn-helix domain-containing protein [Actinomadura harenae]|uniref:XRE family transcriptional regulator n=1 Tax=Actinomadura harenae TaxID=2483351 RepID=A0A3M2MA36_9ACTN|nr:helix-turn-helix transcriptional regulator [Actinomadura harenae]RMI45930.1 XRE family transcriptional regulator [Actinomadura harenae]
MPAADFLDPFASLWNAMGVQLRHERKLRGLTLDDVARIIDADRQRVGNYEAGRLKLTKLHVEALDEAWGTVFSAMRSFAVKIGQEEDWVKQLWDFEKNAGDVKTYAHGLIPVPLQTEGYARESLKSMRIVADVEQALRERMERTELLLSQLPRLRLWVLIDESALDPPLDSDLKREQLQHLLDMSERVSIRVIPSSEWNIGTAGSFEVIQTRSRHEVGYMWAQLGGKVVLDSDEVRDLVLRCDRMNALALSETATRSLIRQKLEAISDRMA